MKDIKAIETKYKGYRFRSRLEARWAVFFDALGVRWRYETEGWDMDGVWYLPDFHLPDWDVYLEVKPDLPIDEFGDGFFIPITDGNLTTLGKFALASMSSLQTDDKGICKQKIYLACGTPGVPVLGKHDGKWRLQDGCVLVGMVNIKSGEFITPIFPVYAFARTSGGKHLDIWKYYTKPSSQEGLSLEWKESPVLPSESMMCAYIGEGVNYKSPDLVKAYRAARSARFEHGETPTF